MLRSRNHTVIFNFHNTLDKSQHTLATPAAMTQSHANLGYKFHADSGLGIGAFQIENQLRKRMVWFSINHPNTYTHIATVV